MPASLSQYLGSKEHILWVLPDMDQERGEQYVQGDRFTESCVSYAAKGSLETKAGHPAYRIGARGVCR